MRHFIVTIEGPGWTELDELELPIPPDVGAPLETKVGTCIVTRVELLPAGEEHDGKIACRLP